MKLLFSLLLFFGCAAVYAQEAEVIGRLTDDVKILSSDEYGGRKPATPEMERSATFISERFKSLGLKPLGKNYRQTFEIVSSLKFEEGNSLVFSVIVPKMGIPVDKIKPQNRVMENKAQWLPMGLSGNGKVENAELAFVGYGISDPDQKYDDYAGMDVKDKVVIVITDAPDGKGRNGKFGWKASYTYKAMTAEKNGAKAVLFVKPNMDSANVLERLEYFKGNANLAIPAVQVNRTEIAKYFNKGKELLTLEQGINKSLKPASYVLANVKVSLEVSLEKVMSETDNIIGMVEGTEKSDRYIVLGAHYDHLGMGAVNAFDGYGKIHNGADDNASGVAGMLELAKRISAAPLKKSVVFVAFSAEEMGLLGSEHFCQKPPVDLEDVDAMINLDMIGMVKSGKMKIYGTGTSTVFDGIDKVKDEATGLTFEEDAFTQDLSDHAPFEAKKIPAVHFFSGTHSDYHTANDDWEKLNYKDMSGVVSYCERLIRKIDDSVEKPVYKGKK